MANLEEINYEHLSKNVTEVAAKILAFCAAKAPDATVVSLALCPDEDVRSIFWMANTSETIEEDPYSEFDICEWPLGEEELGRCSDFDGDLGLTDVWELVESFGLNEDESFAVYPQIRLKCLQAIADGLNSFRAAVLPGRDDFAILVVIPDDDPSETDALNKAINSADVYQRYAEAAGF